MTNVPTNDELIHDPSETLSLIAEGQGHYARIVVASVVSANPLLADRISALLRDPQESVSITSTLRAGVMNTQVCLHLRGQELPVLLHEHADVLQPIGEPSIN